MKERDFTNLAGFFILIAMLAVPVSAANSIVLNAGNSQSATVDTAVTTPPSVIVRDAANVPIEGIEVTFTVTTGGGSVTGGSDTTDSDGVATVGSWKLGTTAGSNTLTASAANGTTSFVFSATGTAGPVTQIVKNAGDGQSATIGTAVTTPPSVKVMDAFNNPVSGASVIFSAMPASASVSGGSQTTGSDGIATVGGWTLGTVTGSNTLTATSGSHSVIFSATATESANPPTITSISPAVGLNTGTISGVAIAGTYFSSAGVTVNLTRSNRANITGTCTRNSATSLTCSFPLSGADDGSWNVIVTNADGKTATKSSGFTIIKESDSDVTITSISPATARAGDDFSFTITGKDFITSMVYEIYLYNGESDNITADNVAVQSATSIKGKFYLNSDADVDTYYVCIKDSFGGIECKKNLFKITTNKVGSIEIDSKPTGATIYLDDVANGTTPKTIDDLTIGSYKIVLKKSGYQDWSKTVKVEEDKETEVDATLYAAPATTATPVSTTIRTYTYATTPPVKSTTAAPASQKTKAPMPTTWAETPAATEESPVEPAFIVGAVCLALITLRKR
ncbi:MULTISPECIES: PEGA domain-containing protein [unclassified Methanoregula]|uniref:PEGA domain-containing protein n=1 Tax=unclassified Methanoregula TaxID=2649730 RepID=UPI0009D47E38|nr:MULTISPECIES: PEGA domain-containing protein [unclassified Methanoregula]OPX64659.1 MAG: PEGA domain protein [Methanoregula sp. PtaB.Bin085]OPY36027.1 MAG: PEGA domain protein [Methanoregula sp. PtaU1.Bin006]